MTLHVPRVVFVGAMTLDSIALVSEFPGPDDRRIADEITCGGGGPAATAAVAATRLGVPAAVVGTVGDDAEARQILDGLKAEGVDTTAVTTAAGARSGASVIIVDRNQGTRAICTRPSPPIDISNGAELIRTADWVHVDHLGWAPVHDLFAAMSPEARPRLSVDVAYPVASFTPAGADLFCPPIETLRRRYGQHATANLLEAALNDGARTVVTTLGAEGCAAATADANYLTVPGVHVREVVSTLGAGDVFHGALLVAITRGMPLTEAMAYANTAAALSCRSLDGRSKIPTHHDVIAHLTR